MVTAARERRRVLRRGEGRPQAFSPDKVVQVVAYLRDHQHVPSAGEREALDGFPCGSGSVARGPVMEPVISDHVWTIEELCTLLPETASASKRIDKGLILKALGEEIGAC